MHRVRSGQMQAQPDTRDENFCAVHCPSCRNAIGEEAERGPECMERDSGKIHPLHPLPHLSQWIACLASVLGNEARFEARQTAVGDLSPHRFGSRLCH